MGEQLAHFRATLQAKPSIFEVIAYTSLHNSLHPAFLKVVQQLAYANVRGCSKCLKYYDEFFLIADTLLEFYYLRSKGASFAEHFYGLKRTLTNSKVQSLPLKYTIFSLIFLTLVPYIRRKIHNRILEYREEVAQGLLRDNFNKTYKKTSIQLFNLYEIAHNLYLIKHYLHYMSDQSQSQLFSLKLIDLKLSYAMDVDEEVKFWDSFTRGRFMQALSTIFSNLLTTTLHTSAFFIQFLNVWNAEQSNFTFKSLPVTPAPYLDNNAKRYANRCPICLQKWRIPTVLTVSGYVYCFSCIRKHLQENSYCPVTKLASSNQQLIRLYDDQ